MSVIDCLRTHTANRTTTTTNKTMNHQLRLRIASLVITIIALTTAGCASEPATSSVSIADSAEATRLAAVAQPVRVTGNLTYSNDIFLTYHRSHAVALVDMHGFVLRDPNWEVKLPSVIFGRLKIDAEHESASYQLDLPLRPDASVSDADRDTHAGVKVYAVSYWADPFEADETFNGWPTYNASISTDAERGNEVTGGKLVVWSPDDQQRFPSSFGADKKLFTADDPLQALPAGYSVVDLDSPTFALDRSPQPTIPLLESVDLSTKDYSNLSYRDAFAQLFAYARRDYAFNGILGKEPDWAALLESLAPKVAQAEADNDEKAFFLAMRAFVEGMHDGHSNIDGGDIEDAVNAAAFGGGYGFAVRELEDGQFLVAFVMDGGPAAKAGVRKGAVLRAIDTTPTADALIKILPPTGPFSTRQARRYDQVRYLTRAPVGTSATFIFATADAKPQTVTLKAIDEQRSLRATSIHRGADPTAPPVEFWIEDSGLGYVRINSNDDDLDLIDDLFRRALDSFDYHEVPGVIIDMRQNDGGTNLDLAGYLTNKKIPLARLEYYNSETGHFAPDGGVEQVEPSDKPHVYKKLALLVGPACFSACEIEAYGFSKLANAIVVGQYPTAGVEAEVARGAFELPAGIHIQLPTGRYVLPNGELFLEGEGVAPTLRVPVNKQTVLSDDDEVLNTAEQALMK